MSRAAVGLVVENLLTDENLRARFAVDPMATVAELFLWGLDLTRDEIDLLCRTDAGLWFLRSALRPAAALRSTNHRLRGRRTSRDSERGKSHVDSH